MQQVDGRLVGARRVGRQQLGGTAMRAVTASRWHVGLDRGAQERMREAKWQLPAQNSRLDQLVCGWLGVERR